MTKNTSYIVEKESYTCSAKADITFPRVVNDLLMLAPS
jgi:hypothetical protein